MTELAAKSVASQLVERVRQRGKFYWARVVILAIAGIYATQLINDDPPDWLTTVRMWSSNKVTPVRQPKTADTAAVLISNDDYWKGELAHRSPVKRDFLGRLIERLCGTGQADLVALDFIFRSPAVDGSIRDSNDYIRETDALVASINRVIATTHCSIVLPVTLSCPPDQKCTRQATVLDDRKFAADRVSWGNINLLRDTRQIPGPATMVDDSTIDSMAGAMVRSKHPGDLPSMEIHDGEFPYGTYLSMSDFQAAHAVLYSDEVESLSDGELWERVHSKLVLIGGAWNTDAYQVGALVDSHESPAASIPGVLLHLNYVAAVLDNRVNPQIPRAVEIAIDVLVVTAFALTFAALGESWYRWLILLIGIGFVLLMQYLTLRLVGSFFDGTIPVIVLTVHWFVDEQHHQRLHIKKLTSENRTLKSQLTLAEKKQDPPVVPVVSTH